MASHMTIEDPASSKQPPPPVEDNVIRQVPESKVNVNYQSFAKVSLNGLNHSMGQPLIYIRM